MAVKWNITFWSCVLLLFFVLQGRSSGESMPQLSEEDADIFSPFWIYRGSCLAKCFKDTAGCEVTEPCSADEKPELVMRYYGVFGVHLNVSWRHPQGGRFFDRGVIIYQQNDSLESIATVFQASLSLPLETFFPKTAFSYFTFADCGLVWTQDIFDCGDIDPLYNVTGNILRIWIPQDLRVIHTYGFRAFVECVDDVTGVPEPVHRLRSDNDLSVEIAVPDGKPVTCSTTIIVSHSFCPMVINLPAFSPSRTLPSASVRATVLNYHLLSDPTFDQEADRLNISWPDCPPANGPTKSLYLHWGELRHAMMDNVFLKNQFILLPQNTTSHVLSGLNASVEYGFQVFCVYNESYVDRLKSRYKTMRYKSFQLESYEVLPLHSTHEEERRSSPPYLLIGISAGGVIAVFLISLIWLVYHRSRSSKDKIRRMEQSIQNVYDDHPSRNTSRKSSAASDQMTLSDFHKSVMLADHWEFDPKRLRLGSSLGKGAFGQVVEGFLDGRVCVRQCLKSGWEWVPQDTGKKEVTRVAVKLLKDFASDAQKQEFLQEIQMMKYLGYHPNVVCLIGCCTVMDPVCLVVEACPEGDLKKYLLSSRNKILTRLKEENLEVDDLLTAADLLSFARQITMGMEYLSQKGYVHRDLAARNVLVSEDKSMKIADFGLTRYIYEERQYIGKKGARIPVKWMSVEAIIDGVYTTESDVWSFGVILYEIITLGSEPYPGIVNKDLAKMLCSGFRMERPEQCPDDLYTIMLDCWHESPKQRPSFTKLRLQLEAMLEVDTPYLSLYPSQAHIFRCLEDIREESDEPHSAGEGEPMLEEAGNAKNEGSRQPSPLRLAIGQSDSKLVEQADSDDSVLEGESKELVDRLAGNSFSEYVNAGGRNNREGERALSLLSSPDSCDSGVTVDSRFLYDSEGKVLEYEGVEQMV